MHPLRCRADYGQLRQGPLRRGLRPPSTTTTTRPLVTDPQTPGHRTACTGFAQRATAYKIEALEPVREPPPALDLRRRYGPDSITASTCPRPPTRTTTCSRNTSALISAATSMLRAALAAAFGSVAGAATGYRSAMSNSHSREIIELECFMVVGSNTAETRDHRHVPPAGSAAERRTAHRRGPAADRDDALCRTGCGTGRGLTPALFNALARHRLAEGSTTRSSSQRAQGLRRIPDEPGRQDPGGETRNLPACRRRDVRPAQRASTASAGAAAILHRAWASAQGTHGDQHPHADQLALLCTTSGGRWGPG